MGNRTEAFKVHSAAIRNGHCADYFVCNVLLSSLCKVGKAEHFMHHTSPIGLRPNSVSFDCIINGYGSLGNGWKAFSMFDELIRLGNHPSHFTYGGLLKGLCKSGNLRDGNSSFVIFKTGHSEALREICGPSSLLGSAFSMISSIKIGVEGTTKVSQNKGFLVMFCGGGMNGFSFSTDIPLSA